MSVFQNKATKWAQGSTDLEEIILNEAPWLQKQFLFPFALWLEHIVSVILGPFSLVPSIHQAGNVCVGEGWLHIPRSRGATLKKLAFGT